MANEHGKDEMTHLELASEVEQLRDVIRSFARSRLTPSAEDAERERTIPPSVFTGLDDLLSPLDAGHGLDPVMMAIVAEELGAADPAAAYEALGGLHAAMAVGALATSAQLDVLAGSGSVSMGSLWLYEGFGCAPDEYATEIDSDTVGLVVNGAKLAVARPGVADFAVVIARYRGNTAAALLTDDELAACRVVRDDRQSNKLGLRAAHTGDVALAAVRLRPEALLTDGADGAGDRIAASARLSTAAIAVGCASAAIDYAAQYATTRHAFGQSIASYQGVSFPLAESDMAIRGARAAIQDLAYRLADNSFDAATLGQQTRRVVTVATGTAVSATATALNTLGGHGYLADYPVERWYRAAGTLAAIDSDPARGWMSRWAHG
jgi:alkylation response protein AidB-like acyl-CoA dehydrogenase